MHISQALTKYFIWFPFLLPFIFEYYVFSINIAIKCNISFWNRVKIALNRTLEIEKKLRLNFSANDCMINAEISCLIQVFIQILL